MDHKLEFLKHLLFDVEIADNIHVMNLRVEQPAYDCSNQIRVDRKSVLGNPFHNGTRDENCDNYRSWLANLPSDSPQHTELRRLVNVLRNHGRLELYCWCAPERCHADYIKEVVSRAYRLDKVEYDPGEI